MSDAIKGVGDEALANAVFERVKGDLAGLKPDELLPISLDISQAVATVLGVLPEVRALRAQIVKELPAFDVAQLDKLEDYALALNFTNASYLSATRPPDDLRVLSQEASKMRAMLLAEVKSLVLRGLVSAAKIGQLKGANGYKNVATDLMVLTNVMQVVWSRIQGKTPTTVEDLETASRLGTRLLRVVGLREQRPARVAEATDQRLRAYTLLLVTYDDARRAVTYLRSDRGGADTIAPSLHPGRPRAKKSDARAPVTTPPANDGGGPVALAAGPNAPAGDVPAPAPVAATAPAAVASAGGPFIS